MAMYFRASLFYIDDTQKDSSMQVRRASMPQQWIQNQPLTDILAAVPRKPVHTNAAAPVQTVVLPPAVQAAKAAVIEIASRNTTRLDNIKQVRAELEPHVRVLTDHFAANRPSNEVELTKGTWKNIWFDDVDIDRVGALPINREKIWQVVKDAYYYNVSESNFTINGIKTFPVQDYLKGLYTITQPKAGDPYNRKNIISLTFDDNKAWFGRIPSEGSLSALVARVDANDAFTLTVPGPKGIRGELWNLFVDGDLRIGAGLQTDKSLTVGQDWYILTREKGSRA
jgi:hypothetical protein